jgi:putative transposase
MSYYQRSLPHWHPDGAPIFLTWRLFGSTPCCACQSHALGPGHAFVHMDRQLDRSDFGPVWLKDDRVATCVVGAFHFGDELKLYELRSYVIMPNHVHLLIRPAARLARITKSIKGYTAREANRILGRTGSPFWQFESYDHWVRNEVEMQRIVRYIEHNPVSSGFVHNAEEWRWSSAHRLPIQPAVE